MNDFNKNEHQSTFNQVKGTVAELNDTGDFCSITLELGYQMPRFANFIIKKDKFKKFIEKIELGDRVAIIFYISSKFKHERWYTTANVMGWNFDKK